MGGLLCRAMVATPGAADDVRAVVTLGTPFDGAAKAAVMLSSGRGAPVPLPKIRMRALVTTRPGLYDLLPHYRCVDEGTDSRNLTAADVAGLGGDHDLATAAIEHHRSLAQITLPGHRVLVGADQPTAHSLLLRDGIAEAQHETFGVRSDGELVREGAKVARFPGSGDGTVPGNSAMPVGVSPAYLPQQHGALAMSKEAIAFATSIITEQDEGPRLGGGGIGIDLPDVVPAGAASTVPVVGTEPGVARCVLEDLYTGQRMDQPPIRLRDGRLTTLVTPPAPGLYRVRCTAAAPLRSRSC